MSNPHALNVSAVREKQLPEFDDELAKTSNFGETLDEMRTEIRERLTEREQRRADEEYERKVIDAVVDQATIEIPVKLIERAMDNLVSRTEERIRQQGIPFDLFLQVQKKSPAELREEQRPNAERSLKTEFVLNEIAQREGIEVTPDELGEMVEGMAQIIGSGDRRKIDQARRELSNPRTRSGLAHDIMENKVRARLTAMARGDTATPPTDATGATPPTEATEATPPPAESATPTEATTLPTNATETATAEASPVTSVETPTA